MILLYSVTKGQRYLILSFSSRGLIAWASSAARVCSGVSLTKNNLVVLTSIKSHPFIVIS